MSGSAVSSRWDVVLVTLLASSERPRRIRLLMNLPKGKETMLMKFVMKNACGVVRYAEVFDVGQVEGIRLVVKLMIVCCNDFSVPLYMYSQSYRFETSVCRCVNAKASPVVHAVLQHIIF